MGGIRDPPRDSPRDSPRDLTVYFVYLRGWGGGEGGGRRGEVGGAVYCSGLRRHSGLVLGLHVCAGDGVGHEGVGLIQVSTPSDGRECALEVFFDSNQ